MLDRKEYRGAVLMGLSKTFDAINYHLLLVKLLINMDSLINH